MNRASNEILFSILKFISLTALAAWLLGISFVHYMLFVLTTSNIFLLMLVVGNKERSDFLPLAKNQSDGQVSRIYDSNGNVIGTKYTENIENGYWVSIITDEEMNLKTEHIRTFSNTEKHKNDRESLEHKYNKDVVWGENYKKRWGGMRFAEKMKKKKAMRI